MNIINKAVCVRCEATYVARHGTLEGEICDACDTELTEDAKNMAHEAALSCDLCGSVDGVTPGHCIEEPGSLLDDLFLCEHCVEEN